MINYLSKFFTKQPQLETENIPQSDDNDNILGFILDDDEVPIISVIISRMSDDDAKRFGKLLYYLNSGLLQQSIFDIFQSKMNDSPDHSTFIQKVFWYWGLEVGNNTKSKNITPCILPTDFNKIVHK